jgi:hypothetical protein
MKRTLIAVLFVATLNPSLLHSQQPAAHVAPSTTKFLIVFEGLIAYVDSVESGEQKLYALFPDANYSLPVSAQDFPPGVTGTNTELQERFPRHFTHLSFENAVVVDQSTEAQVENLLDGFSIEGNDLTISFENPAMLTGPSIDLLASSKEAKDGCTNLDANWGKVQARFLDAFDNKLFSNGELSSRVKILNGGSVSNKIVAENLCPKEPHCPNGKLYTLETTNGVCAGNPVEARLAQRVIFTATTLAGERLYINIRSLTGSRKLEVKRKHSVPVFVKFFNTAREAFEVPSLDLCEKADSHLEAFRWFYRLMVGPADSTLPYFLAPKMFNCEQSDTRCPQVALQK